MPGFRSGVKSGSCFTARGGPRSSLVYSVVNSLGSLPGVKRVAILIEGKPVDGLGAKIIDLGEPLEPFPRITETWVSQEYRRQKARRENVAGLPADTITDDTIVDGRIIDFGTLSVVRSYQLRGYGHPRTVFVDVTGDGGDELVVIGPRGVRVYPLHPPEEAALWEYDCGPLPEGSGFVTLLADLNDDGVPELVVFPTCNPLLLNGDEMPATELLVVAGDGRGVSVVWRTELGERPITGFLQGDFWGEGRERVVLSRTTGPAELGFEQGSYCLVEARAGVPGRIRAVVDLDGAPPPELIGHSNWEGNPGCTPEYIAVLRWKGDGYSVLNRFGLVRPCVAVQAAGEDSPGYLALASVLLTGVSLYRWEGENLGEPRDIEVTSPDGEPVIVWDLAFVNLPQAGGACLLVTGSLPSQSDGGFAVLLDGAGKQLFSSRLTNHIVPILTADIDGDGQPELLAGNDIFRWQNGEWRRYVLTEKQPRPLHASQSIVAALPGPDGQTELFISVYGYEEGEYRGEIVRARFSLGQ